MPVFGEGKDEVGNIMNQECRIMFREIRKKRNKIEDSAAEELLQNSRRGVLAVNGMMDIRMRSRSIIFMTGRTGKSIFMVRARGIRSMHCGYVIRYVLRFMEMRRSGGRLGTVYAEYGCVREMSFDGKWQ